MPKVKEDGGRKKRAKKDPNAPKRPLVRAGSPLPALAAAVFRKPAHGVSSASASDLPAVPDVGTPVPVASTLPPPESLSRHSLITSLLLVCNSYFAPVRRVVPYGAIGGTLRLCSRGSKYPLFKRKRDVRWPALLHCSASSTARPASRCLQYPTAKPRSASTVWLAQCSARLCGRD